MNASRPHWLAPAAVLVAAMLPALPAHGEGRILYDIDFEKAAMAGEGVKVNERKTFDIKRDGAGQRPTIVFDPSAGSRVLVVDIGPTPKGAPKDRSELQLYSGIEFNRTWAVQMKVFIPKGKVGDQWQSFAQCPQGDAPKPAFTVKLNAPDKVELVARSENDDYETLVGTTVPINRWFTMDIEFKLGRDGGATLWIDGQKIGSAKGAIGFESAGARCSFKVGTYRGPSPTPFEIRFDDIRLADDHAALMRGK